MIRISKRAELSPKKELVTRISAVLVALLASAVLLAITKNNPFQIYYTLIEGSLGTVARFKETIVKTIPLVMLSLGIAVAFKMKFWNIGAEGQFYMGAFGASYVALFFKDLPPLIMLPAMMLAAMIVGGLWAFIPGVLKVKFGTSESLTTLMLNYVAINWITYLQYSAWKDPAAIGFPKIAKFVKAAVLPKVFGVHIGWIIAIVFAVLLHFILKHSKFGYEITVLGESQTTARYAGMNTVKIMLSAVMLSGALCGLAGMMQASAVEKSLSVGLSGGLGFTAIITTWLARLSPAAIIGVSFAFAMLIQGGNYLQSALQISSSIADVLQGVILFFVLGSEFFITYKVSFQNKKEVQ